ncbi:hypothetical protein PLCT2_00051 [Planctomycetaceae bacterium]|nr:hypothetical protein PLCT2_00051 [Planctomycetaceae bacterium]
MNNWTDQELNALTEKVIGLCIEIHKTLGPGLLESAYGACLEFELKVAGIRFEREVAMPVEYKGKRLDVGYRLDFLIEDVLIIELKAVEKLERIHQAQLLTYLRLAKKPIGLLINFNVPLLKEGIVRLRN